MITIIAPTFITTYIAIITHEKNGGEDGSRTRVLFAITINDYTFIQLVLN